MDINLSRRYLFAMFAMLYFVQGVIEAYQLNFFKPHMDSEGIDADRPAIVASLALPPFMIKWIYGASPLPCLTISGSQALFEHLPSPIRWSSR